MRPIIAALAVLAMASGTVSRAGAHAFLDHASPAVGSVVPSAPPAATLWFTQELEPAFSSVTVTDQSGQQVDLGNARVPPGHADQLQIGLKAVPPGIFTVRWHVVSVDTHTTDGSFTFTVGGR